MHASKEVVNPEQLMPNPDYSYHYPVMKDECCDYLNIKAGGVYVDCTLGGGGHTKAILDRGGYVIGIDQDPDAIKRSHLILQDYIDRGSCEIIQSNFRNIQTAIANSRFAGQSSGRNGRVDGVLMDLGISSFQIDEGSRGFAFGQDGPLDMRMSKGEVGMLQNKADTRLSAHDIVNTWTSDAIADVLYNYGDETRSRSIAQRIVERRPLNTTAQLVDAIASKTSFQQRMKTLARCFQALRIVVNDEIGALEDALTNMHKCIRYGGRFVVMSYHSLEDRRVKSLMRTGKLHQSDENELIEPVAPRRGKNKFKTDITDETVQNDNKLAHSSSGCSNPWRSVTKRAVIPTDAEIAINRRARSAKLRVADQMQLHPGDDPNGLLDGMLDISSSGRGDKNAPAVVYQTAKQLAKLERRKARETAKADTDRNIS
eukprot:gene17702-20164_t